MSGHTHGDEPCTGHGHDHGHSHEDHPLAIDSIKNSDLTGFVEVPGTDGNIYKKILTEGEGDEVPSSGNMVSVHYVGTLTKTSDKFDSSRDRPGTFEFQVGVGQVIKGWDQGIVTMKKGEKCILRCSSDFGYGARGSPPKIPGGACLDFEVELFKWWEKEKEPWELSDKEKVEAAEAKKAEGNAYFKAGKFADAIDSYDRGLKLVSDNASMGGDNAPVALATALALNGAQARLKAGVGFAEAVKACSDALGWEPKSMKALFRRAQAKARMSEFKEAIGDLDLMLESEPDNADAKAEKVRVQQQAAKSAKAEKAMYGKMFG